jgi:hypothetical protein
MPPTEEGRPLPRKMKHDTSKTLGERTKKQHDTPRALQVGYRKHIQQPLSEMSHAHRDFFGFVALSSCERTQASIDKKCSNYVKRRSPVTPPTTTTIGWEALPRYKTIINKGNRNIGINLNDQSKRKQLPTFTLNQTSIMKL